MSTEVYTDEEDWEDDDDYLLDEIDELEDELEVADINAAIRNLEAAHGAPFTQAQIQTMGELIDQGYTPESVYEAVDPTPPHVEQFDNQFVETIQHLEQREGRPLANSEQQALYDQATYLNNPRHVEPEAIRDLGTRKGRIAHIDEGIAARDPGPETPELIEPLGEDAGKQERIDYMNARVNGAEVDTYEGEE